MRYRRPLSIIHGRGHGSVPRVLVSPGVLTPFDGYGHGGARYDEYNEPVQEENLAPGEDQDSDQIPDLASGSSSDESSSLTTYTEYTPATTDRSVTHHCHFAIDFLAQIKSFLPQLWSAAGNL